MFQPWIIYLLVSKVPRASGCWNRKGEILHSLSQQTVSDTTILKDRLTRKTTQQIYLLIVLQKQEHSGWKHKDPEWTIHSAA